MTMNNEQSARRHFLHGCGIGLGATALAQLLKPYAAAGTPATDRKDPLAPKPPHFTPKAEQVIYLFMAGGPSQFELFSDKPMLNKLNGQPPPKSLMEGK